MASEADFDPSRDSLLLNMARLFRHTASKGVQAGGVVGLAAVAPALAFRDIRKTGTTSSAKILAAVGRTAAVTLGVSIAMTVVRMAMYEDLKPALEDRAYRLHYNEGQNRCDLFASAGAAVGGAAAIAAMGPVAWIMLGGVAAGAGCGVLAHVATSGMQKKD